MAENAAVNAGYQTGPSSFRKYLSTLRPALHLWGALRIRGGRLTTGVQEGYDGPTDCRAFVTEAMILLRELRQWREDRKYPDKSLAGEDFLGPWDGWYPAEGPRTGRLHPLSIPQDMIPVRRSPGRRRKTTPARE